MEQEHTLRSPSLSPEEPLTLPHFDEEATIQSARPVVPLHEVKAEARSKRRLLLGAALVIAASLGALTSLIYNRRVNPQEASATTTAPNSSQALSDSSISASGGAAGLPVNSDPAPAPLSGTENVNPAAKVGATRPESSLSTQTSRARRNSESVASTPVVQDREDEILAEESEMIRAQRREARRLRRERRLNENRTGDGLTRIREIFEGSPKP